MILGKEEILNEIKKGNLKINPFNIKNIRGSSIDLTLDNKFRIFDKDITGEDYRKYSKLVTKNENYSESWRFYTRNYKGKNFFEESMRLVAGEKHLC